MKELRRLLRFVRPYRAALAGSVVLMALVGAMHAMIALLVGPVFDRVLNPASAESPVVLFTVPFLGRQVLLQNLVPAWIHNIWTSVAVAIVAVFLIKGICEYGGSYLVNY
ncbi:MAG: ABC transporter ATP-binding protein, partial [Acidobacteriota bacterium]